MRIILEAEVVDSGALHRPDRDACRQADVGQVLVAGQAERRVVGVVEDLHGRWAVSSHTQAPPATVPMFGRAMV